MSGGTTAAELIGGVGLFLLGTRLAASGFGVAAGPSMRRRFVGWTSDGLRAFLTGVTLSAVVPGSGALPAGALGLARNGRLGAPRAARLVIGCSFGLLFTCFLVLADTQGRLLQVLGLTALGFGALFGELRARRAAWGELAAGWGLVLLGVHLVGSGWAGIGSTDPLHGGWLLSTGLALAGFGGAFALRSPACMALLAAQGVATGVLDAYLAAAMMIGAAATIPIETLRAARTGSEQDQTVAMLHVVHGALAMGIGMALLIWAAGISVIVESAPLLSLCTQAAALTIVPALVVWPFLGALEHLLLSRMEASGGSAGTGVRIGAQTIPALAVERLALSIGEAAETTRVVARKVLNGTGITNFRLEEVHACVGSVEEEVIHFRVALEGVRWPGGSVARVLHAERAALAYRGLCDALVELGGQEGHDPGGALAVPFLQARLGLLRFIDGGDATPDELIEERETVEARLEELRVATVNAFAGGELGIEEFDTVSERIESMRSLTRTAAEARDARARLTHHHADAFELAFDVHDSEEEDDFEVEEQYELDEAPSLVADEEIRIGSRTRVGEGSVLGAR